MINEEAIKNYIKQKFKGIYGIDITKLGEGVQGAGFLIDITTSEGTHSFVVKGLFPEGLGHDYPSDRASVFLLDLDEYNHLPSHVHAIDVLAEMPDGSIKSIGGGIEYYLLMERVEGRDYFHDLREFSQKNNLDMNDISKIKLMTQYLAKIHSVKKDSKHLYFRKIRDIIGHGECLMGVFDTYPDGTLSYEEMAEIEKLCIDWRAGLKSKTHRLSQIHGDFHPGNIWFKESGNANIDLVLLDRSRGPWGEPADDISALTINYIFFSLIYFGKIKGAYIAGLKLFFDEYINLTGDSELFGVLAPFYAFRAAVVANPLFYPDITMETRQKIFNFARNVLLGVNFEVEKINDYLT